MLEWSITATVLLIGVVAVVYDTIGGLKAVVASDVIQLGMMFGGVAVSVALALNLIGGWDAAWEVLSPERRTAADFRWGVGDDATAPFWAYLIGGWFLYASVYGTDQSYVQRLLATESPKHAQWSLMLGGFVRLPLTLMYIALGISIGAVLQTQPELQAVVPTDRADLLVPQFILLYVPVGLKGLILAAILAAAMSSLDSSLNSLSAVTVRDILPERAGGGGGNPRRELWLGKITTLIWGAIVTGAAFLAGSIDRTVIEAINKIGSAFYGPVLATFCLGLFAKRIGGTAMMAGILVGVAANLTLWLTAAPVHWMWWNLVGFTLAVSVAWVASLVMRASETDQGTVADTLTATATDKTRRVAIVSLLAVFVLTVGLVVSLS
jgi:SSS family solute:Na+ symporter